MNICEISLEDISNWGLQLCNVNLYHSFKLVDDYNNMVGYIILTNDSIKKETNSYRHYDSIQYWNELYSKPSKKISFIKIPDDIILSEHFLNLFDKVVDSFENKETILWINVTNQVHLKCTKILQGFGKMQYTNSFDYIRIFDIYHRYYE